MPPEIASQFFIVEPSPATLCFSWKWRTRPKLRSQKFNWAARDWRWCFFFFPSLTLICMRSQLHYAINLDLSETLKNIICHCSNFYFRFQFTVVIWLKNSLGICDVFKVYRFDQKTLRTVSFSHLLGTKTEFRTFSIFDGLWQSSATDGYRMITHWLIYLQAQKKKGPIFLVFLKNKSCICG